MDVAALGIKIESQDYVTAKKRSDKFTDSAKKNEAAVNDNAKAVSRARDQYGRFIQSGNTATASTKAMSSAMQIAVRSASLFGAAMSAAFSVQAVMDFKDAMAEVSTLVDAATFDMARLEKSALSQSAAFGGSATSQAKAFYSIISAGASSAAEANTILTEANKLAVGGVTSVATAADGLTSVLNAYGDKVESAAAVSDALFVAMRAGKTTIGDLSSSLGSVAPIAASLNVSFDELVGSVSALTKGGISTTEAVTGMRAVLAAIAKPTAEASKLSKQLGIEFTSTGLASKGLQGFLADLVAKTGGSTDALAQLFGGVEALVPVMALSGQAGKDFTTIMGDMATKAGAAQTAFDKMANSPGFQAGRIWTSLQSEILGVSGSLSGPLTAALKASADNMGTIVTVATIFTAGHLAAAILPVIANIVTLATTMGTATVAARGLSVAMAFIGGPIGAAVAALGAGIYYLYNAHEQAKQAAEASAQAHSALVKEVAGLNQANTAAVNSTRAKTQADIIATRAALSRALAERELIAASSQDPRARRGRVNNRTEAISGLQEQLDSLNRLNQSMAISNALYTAPEIKEATENTAALTSSINLTSTAVDTLSSKGPMALDKFSLSAQAANDNIQFASSTMKGFFSEIYSGLSSGGDAWEVFGNAANSVLDKIVDNLLNNLVDAIFQVNSASSSGSGGFLSGISSFIGGLFGGVSSGGSSPVGTGQLFASGGYTGNSPATAAAGIVHGGEYVFSKAATDRIGVGNLESMHKQAKGYASGGYVSPVSASGASGGGTTKVVIQIADDLRAEIVQEANQNTVQIVQAAAGPIANQAVSNSKQDMAKGGYDANMSRFGQKAVARAR